MIDDFTRGYKAAERHYSVEPLQALRAIEQEARSLRELVEHRTKGKPARWATEPLDRIIELAEKGQG